MSDYITLPTQQASTKLNEKAEAEVKVET